jgi:hypothetical protein
MCHVLLWAFERSRIARRVAAHLRSPRPVVYPERSQLSESVKTEHSGTRQLASPRWQLVTTNQDCALKSQIVVDRTLPALEVRAGAPS